MYFYELHEGDDEIFMDLLLVHEEQFEPEDFFELVQAVRGKVQDTHEEDTLIEAIALELEREHGFTFVSDARLEASVHVSMRGSEDTSCTDRCASASSVTSSIPTRVSKSARRSSRQSRVLS